MADYISICWSLGLINCHNLFENKNNNEIVNIFHDIINNLITKYVLKKYNYHQWFKKYLKMYIHKK